MGGVIARFEVDQEVAAFVEEKRGSTPSEADIETLDAVYQMHIRPTLDALETSCRPLVGELFRTVNSSFSVEHSGRGVQIGGFLESGQWERTKQQYFVQRGFTLSDSRSIELTHHYRFDNYTGKGRKDFNVVISVRWQLGAESFTRDVAINDTQVSSLGTRISYFELYKRSAEVDQTVAGVSQGVLQEMERLSN